VGQRSSLLGLAVRVAVVVLSAIAGFPTVASAALRSWSGPIALDRIGYGRPLDGVACPMASRCTAADQEGRAVTFNPTAPGTPTPMMVDPGPFLQPSPVAGPSASQCTTVDFVGQELTFNPTAPGTPTPTQATLNPLTAVACPAATALRSTRSARR
jgi:hypothetical protein